MLKNEVLKRKATICLKTTGLKVAVGGATETQMCQVNALNLLIKNLMSYFMYQL